MNSFADICKTFGIALTGGIASGKSTVAGILRGHGHVVVDADLVSRIVVAKGSEGLGEVVAHFGPGILNDLGEMDRIKMRGLVFADPAHRMKLEGIIHKRLNAATEEVLAKEGVLARPRLWFYEASLIYERNRAADFREVWVAWCPVGMQIQRVMLRDKCSREAAEAILKAQMPAAEKKARADRVIDTDCAPGELERRVVETLKKLEGI